MASPSSILDYKETFITGTGPTLPPQVDLALLEEWVTQLARTDAASGAWSPETIAAHEGPLPGETYLGTVLDTHIASAPTRALEATSFDAGEKYQAEHSIGPTTLGINDSGLHELEKEHSRLSKTTEDLKARLATTQETLHGKKAWSDGATYTAPVPATPVIDPALRRDLKGAKKALNKRPEVRHRKFVNTHSSVLIGLADVGVLMLILGSALDTDNLFEVAAFTAVAVMAAVVLPHAAGVRLSELLHGAQATVRRWVPILGFLIAWVGISAVVSSLRTNAARNNAIDELVTRSQDTPTPLTYPQAAQQVVFDSTGQLLLWASLVMATGCVVIAVKWLGHNPALDEYLTLQTSLVLTELETSALTADRSRITDKVATLQEISINTAKAWTAYADVLRTMRNQLVAAYRVAFINALADPESTGYLAATDPTGPAPAPIFHIIEETPEGKEA